MSEQKTGLAEEPFVRSIPRTIDRETMLDLMALVIYEADREGDIEDAGFDVDRVKDPAIDCLVGYVLDALGVPPETKSFYRKPFEDVIFDGYWLGNRYQTLSEVLDVLIEMRDQCLQREVGAEQKRAQLYVVGTEQDLG